MFEKIKRFLDKKDDYKVFDQSHTCIIRSETPEEAKKRYKEIKEALKNKKIIFFRRGGRDYF